MSKKVLRAIFNNAIYHCDPYFSIKNKVKLKGNTLFIEDKKFKIEKPVFVVGFGKASVRMAQACEEIFKNFLDSGIVITKYGHINDLKKIKIFEASHPIPDENSVAGANLIIEFVEKRKDKGDFVVLISGGGSALFCLPEKGITLKDKKETTEMLLKAGASINEINTVRKHLSRVKGGKFAKFLFPARVFAFVISDVIGDLLDVIASGPLTPDKSTFKDSLSVIEKYRLLNRIPENVKKHLLEGLKKEKEKKPEKNNKYFKNIFHFFVANNSDALLGAKERAEALGYKTTIISSSLKGEAKELAKSLAEISKEFYKKGEKICVLAGGEPTVILKNKGKGGRCQELALSFAMEIKNKRGISLLAAGTDGTDGPTDAAGAFCDWRTINRAKTKGLDPIYFLKKHRSYDFFNSLNDLFKPGPTGTNVMDVYIILINP